MEGTPKAIEIKGIVRNATKIGVQDGQAEDLINLRFMDGSWRASGDGRMIENFTMGQGSVLQYTQLYVHTNVYHHLLGVNNGTLYWFAEIDNDGVTFYPLDNTTDRSDWPEDKQDLPTERKALTTVVGDVWITQNGHLLTVIDESDDFEHFVFKTGEDKYIEVNMDVNGTSESRKLFPFGQVHFNWHSDLSILFRDRNTTGGANDIFSEAEKNDIKLHRHLSFRQIDSSTSSETYKNNLIAEQGELRGINVFTGAMLVCAAIRLYDGSYLYASNPVLIYPRQQAFDKEIVFIRDQVSDTFTKQNFHELQRYNTYVNQKYDDTSRELDEQYGDGFIRQLWYTINEDESEIGLNNAKIYPRLQQETILFGATTKYFFDSINAYGQKIKYEDNKEDLLPPVFEINEVLLESSSPNNYVATAGYDLVFSLKDDDVLMRNKDIFTHLCIFVTPETDVARIRENMPFTNLLISPRKQEDIIHDLVHSPMFLLKEYKIADLPKVKKDLIVDLTKKEDEGILDHDNIVQRPQLPTEAFPRTNYLPKESYNYNNRLHIANYKSYPFFGYPIDLFHLHNHSVKVQDGAWFPADADGQRVLPNIADNNDAYLQYTKNQVDITNQPSLIHAAAPFFLIRVYIETQHGDQVVCRYIPAYDPTTPVNGRVDFVEDLNPLLTYPDARAYKMEISYFYSITEDVQQNPVWVYYSNHFKLTPHPYLNIAYYFKPDLKPISLWYDINHPIDFVNPTAEDMKEFVKNQNAEEYFPNGLKVSKTDNPMFFPVENTYQVGSAEILALMSNTIAVGTGQTGDAPLYVFCKDGVYALYVDSSGQMAYPNARILARDVCNNPRSVTPIDAGVVFSTDRGLMMIAGEQVQEIGAPAEGDVVQFWNAGSVDYSKIATASMQQIAGLPSELCSTTDFLTYLQDKGTSGKAAIINYNHNMRELMVSNPNYPYSYVLDREGNWSRRDYTASQYVNNYPTSYRVDAQGHFYKVDDEGDANTSLEHRKEADNKIFYLSNVIKLDSIGFKQAYRFVVRGYFETINPFYWQEVGRQKITGSKPSSDMLILDAYTYAALEVGDVVRIKANGIQEVSVTGKYANNLVQFSEALSAYTYSGLFIFIKRFQTEPAPAIACVVEGSYDGRKFKPLGYNRKSGKFRDIGCIVERTDVRFFRVCLSGQVTGKTRIDYMEMSAGASMLNTKIR